MATGVNKNVDDSIQGLNGPEILNFDTQTVLTSNTNSWYSAVSSTGNAEDAYCSNRFPISSVSRLAPQVSKGSMCTTVTYSSQIRASYPYDKSFSHFPSQNLITYPANIPLKNPNLNYTTSHGLPQSLSSEQERFTNIKSDNNAPVDCNFTSPLLPFQSKSVMQSNARLRIPNPDELQTPYVQPLATVCGDLSLYTLSVDTPNAPSLGQISSVPSNAQTCQLRNESFVQQPNGFYLSDQINTQSYDNIQIPNLPSTYSGNFISTNVEPLINGQIPSSRIPQHQTFSSDILPDATLIRESDKKIRGGFYPTDTRGQLPPSVTTDFIAQDRGICNPRFMRTTLYCLPTQPEVLKQSGVPFAITVCPMANLTIEEKEPPLCLHREDGPLRCKRCKAYMCPLMNFFEGGRTFQCAFCRVMNEVPQDYFCFLDGTGQRTDKFHRAELCLGSYEFTATKEYCRNHEVPNCPAYIFMIEVSSTTFKNGMVQLLCENMKNVLSCLQSEEKNGMSFKVGFVTYNTVLHFYNLKHNLTQPQVMVLADINNAFVPLMDGFLVSVSEAEALINSLFVLIPQLYVNEPSSEAILGPVLQVGLEALKNQNCVGKLLIFHSTLPTVDAPGKLLPRDGQKLLGTDKQKTLLNPQSDFYSKMAQECVAAGCCVDLFLFASGCIDLASISPLCRYTGGQIYKYTYFQSHIDGFRFLEDLKRNVASLTAYDAVLRIRTSTGINPIFYYGNFFMSNATDIEFSCLDSSKAISIEMAYDDKLAENETVCIQAALLYTTCNGERRIRIHNLTINTSAVIADIYRFCELDTIVNFLAKQTLKLVYDQTPQQVRSALVSRAVKMISCYRKYCATGNAPSQLILPDSLKLLPLYINCLLKSDPLCGGPDMSLDDRIFSMVALNSMDVRDTVFYFYPLLFALHEADSKSSGIPTTVRNSMERLHDNGAYLLVNGIYMFLWIGQRIGNKFLEDVFEVQDISMIDKQKAHLPALDTCLSKRIQRIIEDLQEKCQWLMRLVIVIQGDKLEIVFRHFMVEDKGVNGSLSYMEFVCLLQKEVMKLL